MADPTPIDRIAAGRSRLAQRAGRVRRIRRRVFATAAATFALAFGVIATTGSLDGGAAATAADGSATASTSTGGTTSTWDPATSTGQDDGAGGSTATPGMTTRQS
jgi:hypothetical protein